jgi:hypothetical protein
VKLQNISREYKHIAYKHRIKLQFEVEDKFLVHLKNERFPRRNIQQIEVEEDRTMQDPKKI